MDLLEGNNYRDRTKYIRPGTIGLKSRYLLSRVYLSMGDYGKSRKYLEEVQDTIRQLKESRQLEEKWHDYRTVVDLAYCYIRQGNYEEAYQLYRKIGLENTIFYPSIDQKDNAKGDQKAEEDPSTVEEQFLSTLSEQRRISALNNLIRCCFFSIKNPSGDEKLLVGKAVEYLKRHYPNWFEKPGLSAPVVLHAVKEEIRANYFAYDRSEIEEGEIRKTVACNVIQYMEKMYPHKYYNDSETHLLNGYSELLQCKLNENDLGVLLNHYKNALLFFKKACHYKDGFTLYDVNKSGDQSKQRHSVEYLSAYLITVIKLWKITKGRDDLKDEYKDYEEQLRSFLNGVPKKVELSMKSVIALAEWLLEYSDENKEGSDALFRSFCYIKIYKERGAGVFNQLKDNQDFRLLESRFRGKILALLLAMYKPIKALKEECAFNLDDLKRLKNSNDPGKPMDLVHYTSLDTLKVLLTKKQDGYTAGMNKKITQPRFRINNCGYMNDVFEGSVFLRCLNQIALEVEKEAGIADDQRSKDFDAMRDQFFPYLKQTAADRKPVASNVYIGSLSVKADSFPIWDSYANKEKGCNISFGEGYFDINGAQYYPDQLREYMFSNYTDASYPLYIVQYIESIKDFTGQVRKYLNDDIHTQRIVGETLGQIDILPCGSREQHCGTEVIEYTDLCRLLHHIYLRWKGLATYLNEIESSLKSTDTRRIDLARQFAADRLNEIRFLFKDADYEFEAEVRVVHTETSNSDSVDIDYNRDVPKPYTNIERELEGLTIRLGSKIADPDVDMIVTWLKQTGRVNSVELSTRNRYIKRTMQ